jgi:transposase
VHECADGISGVKSLAVFKKIYLYAGPVDMRKSINGLSVIASSVMEKDAFDGSMFVFCSKNKKLIKALYFDETGFAIWQKRLEPPARFSWPEAGKDYEDFKVKPDHLKLLLKGADIAKRHVKRSFKRTH